MQQANAGFHVSVVGRDAAKKVFAPLYEELQASGFNARHYESRSALLQDTAALKLTDVLVAAPGMGIDRRVMEAMPKLRAVLSGVAGFDGIDVDAATTLGIAVANAEANENYKSMAEAVMLLILAALYDLPRSMALMAPDAGPDLVRRRMLGGKTVGVVGYGKIGQSLVARLAHWNAQLQVCAPRLHNPLPQGAWHVDLREIMATSDVICLVCSLNDETRGMVSAELLGSMKHEAVLVSIARDEIIDEAALIDFCSRRRDIRVAMDSFSARGGGPLPADSPLRTLPNAILTPHVVGHTIESLQALRNASIENLDFLLSGRLPPRLLNTDVAPAWNARWGAVQAPSSQRPPTSKVKAMPDKQAFEMIFREAVAPAAGGYPGFNPRSEKQNGMICEFDVAVRMRDGVTLYVDVYRPEKAGKYPALVAWSPYGKHHPNTYSVLPKSGVNDCDLPFAAFEGAEPTYWCPNGYIVINVDPRGTWNSEGDLTFYSDQEAEDGYDLIEWSAARHWSNGKVGLHGVSYLAWIQWRIAALNPPHLAAINPWEGVSDFYREMAFHGGIPEAQFLEQLQSAMWFSNTRVEDIVAMAKQHPLFDDYWARKNADLSKITVPAYVVASWSDHGLHSRGTLEAFKKIASEDKWLMVHGRKKWQNFYENVERQRQFFDRFLKGIDSEVKYWPRVKLEIRERFCVGNFRSENEWPPARTQYKKLFLDAAHGTLSDAAPGKEAQVRYNADKIPGKNQHAKFQVRFDERTELTGNMKLKLWVQADASDDMDLFVAIEKIDRTGDIVPFQFFCIHEDGPVALGWLRVSHRELDEKKSTPWQPVLKHEREIKLQPGEIVPVEIEVLPSSTLFEPGEKLQVTVQGSDIYRYPFLSSGHTATVNRGDHVIHTGGKYDSYLLVPTIPDRGVH